MLEHSIVVIGASAGGVEALIKVVRLLPERLPGSIFIVLHIPSEGPDLLPGILSRYTKLVVEQAVDQMPIEQGHIYIAPPDHHMLVKNGFITISHGPRENRHRPSIDVLFRSAAISYGEQVIGIILTGSLDDGTAGLLAIKQLGGIVVIQDPREAAYPSMPASAQAHVQLDYTSPLHEIAPLVDRLVRQPAVTKEVIDPHVKEQILKEVRFAEMDGPLMNHNEQVGAPSMLSCPECGGVLWEVEDGDLLRFRCRVGHAYSTETVFSGQEEAMEDALWTALKVLEESAALSSRLEATARGKGQNAFARRLGERKQEALARANVIQKVLKRKDARVESSTEIDLDAV